MPLLTILIVLPLSLLFLGILAVGCARRRTVRFPTPPGPKGWAWSIVGNLFDMPREYEWMTYRKWSCIYSKLLCAFSSLIVNNILALRFGYHPCERLGTIHHRDR
jgi:hypothetical protein